MKSLKSKILLRVIILVALLLAIGLYLFGNPKPAIAPEAPLFDDFTIATTSVGQSSTSTVSIDAKLGETISLNPYETGSNAPDRFKGAKLPDLGRPLVIPDDFPAVAKERLSVQHKELLTTLPVMPSDINGWLTLGSMRKMVNDYDGAREIYDFAAKYWPNSPVPYANLGDLYTYYLKDFTKAEYNLRKAVEVDPNFVTGYRSLYDLYYGPLQSRDGAVLAAIDGINKNPTAIDLLILVAGHYRDAGDKVKAKEYYSRILPIAKNLGDKNLEQTVLGEMAGL